MNSIIFHSFFKNSLLFEKRFSQKETEKHKIKYAVYKGVSLIREGYPLE